MRMVSDIGGKVFVSGIGNLDEDEFLLSLLNEQGIWEQISLGSEDSLVTKKRFLSRTARYSGLLDVLTFVDVSPQNETSLTSALTGANTWLAFNASQDDILKYSDVAIAAGIKRAVFTTELAPERINDTSIPEFDHALNVFEQAGGAFTGIRHGTIIPGDENNPYEIVNASVPCLEDTVERGVLSRVVAELTCIPDATNKVCGLSSSGAFTQKYLELLRATGVNRRQEVAKVFNGGIQKLARIALDDIKRNNEIAREKQEAYALAKAEEEEEDRKREERNVRNKELKERQIEFGEEVEDDIFPKETEDAALERRTQEILQTVWREYDTRMYTKSTSKHEFFDMNREQARTLAKQEFQDKKAQKKEILNFKRRKNVLLDKFVDVNRKQLAKLQALERKEMQSQKEMSDIWVKYVYLLIEVTLEKCQIDNILFHNLDEYAQTLLLREQANNLRAQCGLPFYAVIYDPLDASVIVSKMATEEIGVKLGLNNEDSEIVVKALNSKYGHMLKSITALRGASQILELAIETLQRELPPPPPTVSEMRSAESAAKQAAVAKMKLAALRNRNQPKKAEESVVGRM